MNKAMGNEANENRNAVRDVPIFAPNIIAVAEKKETTPRLTS